MSRNYYYLVAGLPDIVMEGNKSVPAMGEFVADVVAEVVEADAPLFSLLRRPYDNANLVALLEKRRSDFDPRGSYALEELEEEVKVPHALPEYMQAFIEAHKEGRTITADQTPDDQLAGLFYDSACIHSNQFLREWFCFDRDLRNTLTGLNHREMTACGDADLPSLAQIIIPGSDVAELILRSTAPDFSLGQTFPWIENIVALNRNDTIGFESGIDTLRWDVLNELTTFTYFQIEMVLAFCLKLGIVERWQRLDPETGKEKLERLVTELESGFSVSDDLS